MKQVVFMFKSWRLILTLALLSVVAHPSPAGAQDVFFDMDFGGDASEVLVIAFSVRDRAANGGVRETVPPTDCESASFRITAREASGSSSHMVTEVVDLSPEFGAEATIPLNGFAEEGMGPVHLRVKFSELRRSGQCHFSRPFYRIVDGVTGATRSSGNVLDDSGEFWFFSPSNTELPLP